MTACISSLTGVVHWAFELGLQSRWGTEVQRHLLQAAPLTFKEDDQVQFLSSIRVVRKIGRSSFDLTLGKMVCSLLGATGSKVGRTGRYQLAQVQPLPETPNLGHLGPP